MIDLDKAFAELPPPSTDTHDAYAARRVWLRAQLAPIKDERLRFASVALFMGAIDAIAVLLVAVAMHP